MTTLNNSQWRSLQKLLGHLDSDVDEIKIQSFAENAVEIRVNSATYIIWVNGEMELRLQQDTRNEMMMH